MKACTTALLLFLAMGANAAPATPDWRIDGILTLAESSDRSLDRAVARVQKETGGRILSAETVLKEGRKVHRIKVLTRDRKVRILHVEAGSG